VDHNKGSLVGLHRNSDPAQDAPYDHFITATYHHNRFDCIQRQPRVSRCQVHAYNNVIMVDQEGMQSYDRGKLLAERNLFRRTGAATAAMDFTTDKYPDGRIRSVGNVFENGAINASNEPQGVYNPTYVYTAQTMTAALRDQILAQAGATLSL